MESLALIYSTNGLQSAQVAMVLTTGVLCSNWSIPDTAESVYEPTGRAHTAALPRGSCEEVHGLAVDVSSFVVY